MKYRCYNPKATSYYWYGGKGIKVCDEWLGDNGFNNFAEWSLKNGYSEALTIDRIDSTKDYCPQNCQWIPMNKNRSRSSKGRKNKDRHMNLEKYYYFKSGHTIDEYNQSYVTRE